MPQEYHELPEQVQQNIFTCLKVRREHLTNALLREHYKRKLPTIADFDWRLKVFYTNNHFTFILLALFASSHFFIVGNGIKQDCFFAGISPSVGSHSRRYGIPTYYKFGTEQR